MALRATQVWEIESDGDDANGGGFDSAEASGTDYSQQASPHVTFNGTTVYFTAAAAGLTVLIYGHTVEATDVGNTLHAIGGTHVTPGWYTIDSVVTGAEGTQSWTLLGNGNIVTDNTTPHNDATGRMGGALKSLGGLGAIFAAAAGHCVTGMKAYVKNGTYTLDTATVNTAATTGHGGPLDIDAGVNMASKLFVIKGYDAAQGRDVFDGSRPVIACGSITPANAAMIELKGAVSAPQLVAYISFDGNDKVTSAVMGNTAVYDYALSCYAVSCDAGTNGTFRTVRPTLCKAYDCAATAFTGTPAQFCIADTCTIGFGWGGVFCIAKSCTSHGFTSYDQPHAHCVAYGNGGSGFYDNRDSLFVNCIAYGNTSYGYRSLASSILTNCAAGNNSARLNATPFFDLNPVNLTGNPFVDTTTFALDNTTNEGNACRSVGLAPYYLTTAIDLGAIQHAYPPAGEVLSTCDEMTGTYHVCEVAEVLDSVSFGAGSAQTGTYHAPSVTEVLDSAVFGPASGTSGTYHAPSVGEVLSTAVFGPSSETSGTYVAVAAGNVEEGVTFGAASAETGTFVVPAEEDVEDGVEYGNSAEFTGTLAGGGGVIIVRHS
jgi:hypothetical protein